MSSATYQFKDEDHTLGNALRWALAKNPQVEFVGYTMPHPSEPLMNLRLQTYETPVEQALEESLTNLVSISNELEKKWLKIVKKSPTP